MPCDLNSFYQGRGLEDCLVAFEKLQGAEMKPNTRTLNALMLGARNAEEVTQNYTKVKSLNSMMNKKLV